MRIPSPPELKPTIIQMQSDQSTESVSEKSALLPQTDGISSTNNYVSSTNSGSISSASSSTTPTTTVTNSATAAPKKRRRRSSSSLISQSEVEKRRREHKTAHSIIEKKRRIRMNREFEALKYLVPACRNNLIGGNSNTTNNGEGMYKLTILQATVDYIKYLHNVVNIQHNELRQFHVLDDDEQDLHFADIDLDTDQYRNVDNDFDFNKLLEEYSTTSLAHKPPMTRHSDTLKPTTSSNDFGLKFQSLPSPVITPELYPSNNSTSFNSFRDFNFPGMKASHRKSESGAEYMSHSSSVSLTPVLQGKFIESSSMRRSSFTLEAQQSLRSSSASTSSTDMFINITAQDVKDADDPAAMLLSLKSDGQPVSSIQSLLN